MQMMHYFLILFLHVSTAQANWLNPCTAAGFMGDAALTIEDKIMLTAKHRSKRAVTSEKKRIWPQGIIPYVLNEVFEGKDRFVIQRAMRHWEEQTCISFIPRTREQNYIVFQRDGLCGCCSYVGRMGGNRSQGVNLGRDCVQYGTVIHELGHVIGFWHEHTRPDRDAYVRILKENILPRELKNFRRLSRDKIASLGVPYDFESIMHYAPTTFSKNGLDATILPRPVINVTLGQREKLSPYDVAQANLLYKCPTCMKTLATSNGQFSFKTKKFGASKIMSCIWRVLASSGEKILLTFRYARFRYSCRKVYIEIRAGKNRKSRHLQTFCKHNKPPKVYLVEADAVFIKFYYGYPYFYGGKRPIGVDIEYKVICGGDIRTPSGTIFSPNYPDFYVKNKTCVWNIQVPQEMKIGFKFNVFQLEKSKNCAYDFLRIIDVSNARTLGQFCGARNPPNLVTSGNKAKIVFQSDENVNKAGFLLTFLSEVNECADNKGGCDQLCRNTLGSFKCACRKGYQLMENGRDCKASVHCKVDNGGCHHICVDSKSGSSCRCRQGYRLAANKKTCDKVSCGLKSELERGWLTTPSYPEEYSMKSKCKWHLWTLTGHRYQLLVQELEVRSEKRNNCSQQIFAVSEISPGKVVKRYSACEVKRLGKIDTSTNKLSISLYLEDAESVKFKIYLKSVCGGRLHAKRKSQLLYFYLLHDKAGFPPNQECEWLISGGRQGVSLYLKKFELDSNDNLKIYDGKTRQGHLIADLGTGALRRAFQSASPFLLLVLNSGSNARSKGFAAEFVKVS